MEIRGEQHLLQELISTLIERGYPKKTLITGWRQGGHVYDLAVVDPYSAELLAAFELILQSQVVRSSKPVREKIEKYRDLQTDAGVPLYVVMATKNEEGFTVTQINPFKGENETWIHIRDIPLFEDVRGRTLIQKLAKVVDTFQILCWSIALIAMILLISDINQILTLTPQRLTLMGVIIALILLPYLRKIKVLGVEIERHIQ